jgi:isocitrate dehydrogenase
MPTAETTRVTLIPGDGVGPEVVTSARRIIEAAGVSIDWEEAEAGAEVFRRGDSSGVPRETVDSIERTKVVLKGPLETPVGFGEKSANVTLRKLFETYANVRPARELSGVPTRYSGEGLDFVVVRENIEDLYAGIEYMQTPDVALGLKVISRKGSEKIIRYAFELARREGRKTVTCATKANIMKLTEGLFKRVFEEMAPEYPDIEPRHLIIDNVAHQLAKDPAQFDVIVTTNLNGDIISDLASGLVGGLGFASSGNYGDDVAIFEAVHGSAPKYAGKDVINPTALILSSVLMLRHIGQVEAADRVEDAVLVTLESGEAVTQDLARQSGDVEHAASTTGFTEAVIGNLGKHPAAGGVAARRRAVAAETEGASGGEGTRAAPRPRWSYDRERYEQVDRRLDGVDVYVESDEKVEALGTALRGITDERFELAFISSRGTVVYPSEAAADDVRWYRCRFLARADGADQADALRLVARVGETHRIASVQMLPRNDGQAGYTAAAGQ